MKRLILLLLLPFCCGCEKSTLNDTTDIQGWHNDKEMIWDALTSYCWTFQEYAYDQEPPAVARFFKYPKTIQYIVNYDDVYNGEEAIIETDHIDGFYSIDYDNDPPMITRALGFFKIDNIKPILYRYTGNTHGLQEEMRTIETEDLVGWFDSHPEYFVGPRVRTEENFFFGNGRIANCEYMVLIGNFQPLYSYKKRE